MVKGISKLVLVGVLSTLAVTGCDKKPSDSKAPVVVDIKKNPDNVREFAKLQYAGGAIPEELGVYTIDMKLKSADWVFDSFYNQENPPMPFVAGHVAGYQLERGYTIFFANSRRKLIGGNPMEWTRLTITGDGNMVALYVNGEMVSQGEDDTKIGKAIQLGRGFAQRYWAGAYAYFDIYSGVDLPADFSLDAPRLAGNRVFSLEMAEDVKENAGN